MMLLAQERRKIMIDIQTEDAKLIILRPKYININAVSSVVGKYVECLDEETNKQIKEFRIEIKVKNMKLKHGMVGRKIESVYLCLETNYKIMLLQYATIEKWGPENIVLCFEAKNEYQITKTKKEWKNIALVV